MPSALDWRALGGLERERGCRRARLNPPQLLQDPLDVVPDGRDRQAKDDSDLRIRFPFGHPRQHFRLAWAQSERGDVAPRDERGAMLLEALASGASARRLIESRRAGVKRQRRGRRPSIAPIQNE